MPYVPPTSSGGAVSSVNTRTGAVTGLAEDNAVLHLAGTETATGAKTFTGTVTVKDPSNPTTATMSTSSPYYGRYNAAVDPLNGKSEVRFVSKGATGGAGQIYFVVASTEAADTGNNLLLGIGSNGPFITNAVNYSTPGMVSLGGTSWAGAGVLEVDGASGTGTVKVRGTVAITGGAPGSGKVLTSDATGNASWQTPATGGQIWKIDQIPLEAPNGVRTVFTLPGGDTYVALSLAIHLNGQVLTKVNDFTETSSTTYTFVTAPLTADTIRLSYRTT